MDEVILEMRNIEKRFPGVQALKGVDFVLKHGEVHALVGRTAPGNQHSSRYCPGHTGPMRARCTWTVNR